FRVASQTTLFLSHPSQRSASSQCLASSQRLALSIHFREAYRANGNFCLMVSTLPSPFILVRYARQTAVMSLFALKTVKCSEKCFLAPCSKGSSTFSDIRNSFTDKCAN